MFPSLQLRGCEMTPTESSTRPSSQLSTTSTLRVHTPDAGGSSGRGHGGSRGGCSHGEAVLLKSVYVEGAGWASQVITTCNFKRGVGGLSL